MDTSVFDQLEALVDKHSLRFILQELVLVCDAKAVHVQSNWQDKGLAGCWEKAGLAICAVAERMSVKRVSM